MKEYTLSETKTIVQEELTAALDGVLRCGPERARFDRQHYVYT